MRIECAYTDLVEVSTLKENELNNNKHSEKQVEVLAGIIQNYGQRSPIVISKNSGKIVKGHLRKMAIEKLGWHKCAVDYQSYETELEEYGDLTADNNIARYSEFDMVSFDEALKSFDLNMNEIQLDTTFGLIEPDIDFLESEPEESQDKDEPEEKLQIVIKCADQDELECLTFEFQSKGLSFEVKR